MNHLTGRPSFLFFYIFTIVIVGPPTTLEARPVSTSYSDKNTGLNLTQSAAFDALLNFFPSSSPTKLPLSSVTNSSAKLHFPPDPCILPTEAGDIIQFGVYDFSLWRSDLDIVCVRARDDLIQHIQKPIPGPMPTVLKYRHGPASFDLEVRPDLTWVRWGWALHQIGNFREQAQDISFNFGVFTKDFGEELGRGQVRAYR